MSKKNICIFIIIIILPFVVLKCCCIGEYWLNAISLSASIATLYALYLTLVDIRDFKNTISNLKTEVTDLKVKAEKAYGDGQKQIEAITALMQTSKAISIGRLSNALLLQKKYEMGLDKLNDFNEALQQIQHKSDKNKNLLNDVQLRIVSDISDIEDSILDKLEPYSNRSSQTMKDVREAIGILIEIENIEKQEAK